MASLLTIKYTQGVGEQTGNLKLYKGAKTDNLVYAIKARFGIPDDQRLVMKDERGYDVPVDGALPSGLYQLETRPSIPTNMAVWEEDVRIQDGRVKEAAIKAAAQASMDSTRDKLLAELVTTEESYVNGLIAVNENYSSILLDDTKVQLRKEKKIDCVSKQQAQGLFGSLGTIQDLNTKFLEALKTAVANKKDIGQVFLEFLPYFRMYTVYVSNKPTADRIFNELMNDSKYSGFQAYHNECTATSPAGKGAQTYSMDLASVLLTPIQRIPRYRLLLLQLLKNTSATDPSMENLQKAYDQVVVLADSVNEAMRAHESRQHIMEIQQKFKLEPTLISPSRLFVKEGMLTLVAQKEKPVIVEAVLFNDLFLGCHKENFFKYDVAIRCDFSKQMKGDTRPPRAQEATLTVSVVEPGSVAYYRLYSPGQTRPRAKSGDKVYKTWNTQLLKAVQDFTAMEAKLKKRTMPLNPRSLKEGLLLVIVDDNGEPQNLLGHNGEVVVPENERWEPRYFSLVDQSLYLHRSAQDPHITFQVDLSSGATLVPEPDESRFQLPHCLTITTQHPTRGTICFVLSGGQSTGNAYRADWMAALSMLDPENIRVDTTAATSEKKADSDSTERKYTFMIAHSKQVGAVRSTYFLEAKNQQELDEWTAAISAQAGTVIGSSGTASA